MMSLQWTLVAWFLYVEIAATLILLLPFISSKRWSAFFKSRFVRAIAVQSHIYFIIIIGILVLLFLDSIREMFKYTNEQLELDHVHVKADMQVHLRLFRAQRNFYVAGFALFFCFVLKRLSSLICTQASLEAAKEAAMRQAQSATAAAEKLMNEDKDTDNQDNTVAELKDKLHDAHLALDSALKDKEAMSSQAKSVSEEYDRLMKEHEKLQKELQADKKHD